MQLFKWLFIFTLPLMVQSQNLVPNSGFELEVDGKPASWTQPQGNFFHFTKTGFSDGAAKNGQNFNGICLLNKLASEYLQVKMNGRMIKGEKYKIGMWVKLSSEKGETNVNISALKTIDMFFDSTEKNVQTRYMYTFKPQVSLIIPDGIENYQWVYLENEFIASGYEQYLMIGKFFQDKDSIATIFKTANLKSKLVTDSVKKNEKSVLDSLKKQLITSEIYLKKNKNKKEMDEYKKIMSEYNATNKKIRDENKAFLINYYSSVHQKMQLDKIYYDVRYMFDDIQITGKYAESSVLKKGETLKPGKTIVLNNVFFETAKSVLLPASHQELDKLVKILNENPKMVICINGHTDNVGDDTYNLNLSADRSKSVMNYLISKGIKKERLQSKGYGSTKPVADNNTEVGRQKNRRVEFEIIKMQ